MSGGSESRSDTAARTSRWEFLGLLGAVVYLCGCGFGLIAVGWYYATWALGHHVFPPTTFWWVTLGVTLGAVVVYGVTTWPILRERDEYRAELRRLS